MNSEKFIWTSEEYTCPELQEKFDNKFPVIALVTLGYHGDRDYEQINGDAIMRIHDWGTQQRVVAKDHRGRFITFPTSYPIKIQQLLKTLEPVGKHLTVQEFLNNHVLPKTAQMDKSEVEKLYVGDRSETFGILELLHVYTEKFFKANLFKAGSLDVNSTYIIPMHLGMRFKVALGMKASNADDWSQWLSGINDRVQSVPFSSIEGLPDIFIYNKEADGWNFNNELPVYHVRHPLTLRPGADRDSWTMCVSTKTGRKTAAYGKNNTQNVNEIHFNATTGMRQPTLPDDVQNELLQRLGMAPKKKELVAKPGKFAAQHEMLAAIYRPKNAPTAEVVPEPDYEVGKTGKTEENNNRMYEFKRNSYLKEAAHQAAERQHSKESDPDRDYDHAQEQPREGREGRAGRGNLDNMYHNPSRQDQRSHDHYREKPRSGLYRNQSPYDLHDEPPHSDPYREEDAYSGQYREQSHIDRRSPHPNPHQMPPNIYGYDQSPLGMTVGDPGIYSYGGKPASQGIHYPGSQAFSRIADADSYSYSSQSNLKQNNWDEVESLYSKTDIDSKDFSSMSPTQVAQCLQKLDLEEHIPQFLDFGVDGLILMNLSKEDLRRDFGITGIAAARILKLGRQGWTT